jgi:predicted  nucleic acid-binding Zn-ribbon protein
LRDQLKFLEELQRHDARLLEMEGMLKAIPAKIKGMQADLKRVEDMLAQERSQLSETERYKSDQEFSLRNDEQMLQKAKIKLQAVKNTKEFMATQRELENTRKMAQDREEEVLKLMNALTASRESIGAHEKDVEVIRDTVAKEEAAAQGEMTKLEREIAAARVGRDEVAKNVRQDVMRRYSSIRLKRGLAVVPVKNGTCQGCNMNIPPQLYNVLQRGESLETCPNCNRIIYWDRLMDEAQGPSKEAQQSP